MWLNVADSLRGLLEETPAQSVPPRLQRERSPLETCGGRTLDLDVELARLRASEVGSVHTRRLSRLLDTFGGSSRRAWSDSDCRSKRFSPPHAPWYETRRYSKAPWCLDQSPSRTTTRRTRKLDTDVHLHSLISPLPQVWPECSMWCAAQNQTCWSRCFEPSLAERGTHGRPDGRLSRTPRPETPRASACTTATPRTQSSRDTDITDRGMPQKRIPVGPPKRRRRWVGDSTHDSRTYGCTISLWRIGLCSLVCRALHDGVSQMCKSHHSCTRAA